MVGFGCFLQGCMSGMGSFNSPLAIFRIWVPLVSDVSFNLAAPCRIKCVNFEPYCEDVKLILYAISSFFLKKFIYVINSVQFVFLW